MPCKLDWQALDTVLLDMDGTLLDLHYDATFWMSHVHGLVSRLVGRPEAEVRAQFFAALKDHEGTLTWYCTDHWAAYFGIDLIAAKRELAHLIRYRPHAESFLATLSQSGLRTLIATNAHPDVIALKLEVVPLDRFVESIVSSHHAGVAKEHPDFWRYLFDTHRVDPARALFIDDSPAVLDAAERAGIKEIIEIRHPNLAEPPRQLWKRGIDDFDVLLPSLEAACR